MTRAGDIFEYLQRIAPLHLAESYDNPGLLAGSPEQPVTRALVALDIITPVCEEAAGLGAQLVVSHHPVIFHPARRVLSVGPGRPVWELAHFGLTAVCMHTNLDMANGGVNDVLAGVLGLPHPRILLPAGTFPCKKIVVFVPREQARAVREAMARAGAGRLGNYDSCSFESAGTGRFRPLKGAHPFIGAEGETAQVEEIRLEAICKAKDLAGVIAAMRAAHPYEEPAFDIFDDEAAREPYGIGRVAELAAPLPLTEFARRMAARLKGRGAVVYAEDTARPVRRVALCGGAWDGDMTTAAAKAGADVIFTGEIKHSDVLAARECGLDVVAAGHFATENVVCPWLCRQMAGRFPEVEFRVAGALDDPAHYVRADGAD